MNRIHHNGQLTIEEFHVPFSGTLDSDNRWVLFSYLMPWEALEETYAPQFNPTTGAPAKPVRLAFGALFIKQRLGLTDEETVEQIRENPYLQFVSCLCWLFMQSTVRSIDDGSFPQEIFRRRS